MKCNMKFSMATYKYRCEIHGRIGDEQGCLQGAHERIAELEVIAIASPLLLAACEAVYEWATGIDKFEPVFEQVVAALRAAGVDMDGETDG